MTIPPIEKQTGSIVIPLVVATALLMENLDATVLATAIPTIARDLGSDPVHLKLALTAYLMSLAVFIPASGWIADRFGARKVLVAAIGVFTLASCFCAASQTLGQLVASRVLQGIGGAMMTPVGRLIVVRSTAKHDLVNALAWVTIPALVGPILGPPLGGFAITYATWHWIFLLNIPIGIAGMALSWWLLPTMPVARRRFDAIGFILSGVGLSLIVVAASLVTTDKLAATIVGAASVLMLWLFVRHARHAPQPIIELDLLRIPTLRASLLGGTFFRIGVGAVPFMMPLLLQLGFGMTALSSGLITFAAGAGALLMKFTAARILRKFGYRRVLVANGMISALLIALPVLFTPVTPGWLMIGSLFLAGFLRSLQFTAQNALAFADVADARVSAATTMSAVAQQIAASLGVSLAAMILQSQRLPSNGSETSIQAFDVTFIVIACVALLSVPWYWMLPPGAGQQLVDKVTSNVEVNLRRYRRGD